LDRGRYDQAAAVRQTATVPVTSNRQRHVGCRSSSPERPTPSAPAPTVIPDAPTAENPAHVAARIAVYSGLILFFELAFIRYTSAYVRVFSFYQNFVLLATFLGMGVGLMRARSAGTLRWLGAPALLAMIGAIYYFSRAAIAADVAG
jgi:hypothetical protein